MRDADRLRKEADRLLADANEAKRQGKSEGAERLELRAAQCLQDAAVLEAPEIRLRAEQAKRPRLIVTRRT